MINIDYQNLPEELGSGVFRNRLKEALIQGFQELVDDGERLPPVSYYAAKMAEIVNAGSPIPLEKEFAFNLFQEISIACEEARNEVLGEDSDLASS